MTAQFVFNGGECVRDVLHLEREERASTSGLRELLKNLVAAQDQATVISRDGVNDDLGALGHFNGLRPGELALVVLAIAQDNDGLAYRMPWVLFQQLVARGAVNSVI